MKEDCRYFNYTYFELFLLYILFWNLLKLCFCYSSNMNMPSNPYKYEYVEFTFKLSFTFFLFFCIFELI